MAGNYYPVMEDGFSTTVAFERIDNGEPLGFVFYEKDVKPSGFDMGGGIDTTGMRNEVSRTMAPKKLCTMTPIVVTVAYNIYDLPEIYEAMGVRLRCFHLYPIMDGEDSTLETTNTGFIDKFEPNTHKEGEQPTATLTFIVGMEGTDTHAQQEADWIYQEV